MVRSLFAKRPSPYYILAPDYRRSSAGIRVLHMLCDALMRSGQEAYITAQGMNPGLMTPLLTDAVMATHRAQGIEPIIIYPEVVDGNPLEGNVVVRYLLNRPGFLAAISPFAETDVLFSYTRELLQPGMDEERVLYMPAVDLSIFCPPTDNDLRVPGRVCYYRGRQRQVEIDPSLLGEDAVEITSQSPASWEELAALFQSCEYFYCPEPSGLAAEAALCGCVAVVLPGAYAPKPLSQHENNSYGVAWGNTPESLQRARETLPLLRESLLQHQQAFWRSLDRFIDITQEAVEQYRLRSQGSDAQRWLERRVLTEVQQTLVAQYLQEQRKLTLAVVILDHLNAPDKLQDTLDSLSSLAGYNVSVRPFVVPDIEATALPTDAARRSGVEAINACIAGSACDLFMLVAAGETFTASGLLSLALERAAVSGCRAMYADEAMRDVSGKLELQLRPSLNLDLLLSLPAAMVRHWLYDRQVWTDLGGFDDRYPQAFELEFILRLIEVGGLDGLGHISEPLVVSQTPILQDLAQEREVIEHHLRKRGFEAAQVSSRLPGRYELDYGHASSPPVSILILVEASQLTYVQRCVQSLLEHTDYSNFEVLLLNRSGDDPALIHWLSGIEQMDVEYLRVLHFATNLTEESIRNQAALESRGEFLVFLDAHVGVIEKGWLKQLLNHAMRPEVGAVGAKLINGEGRVRHAGVLLGLSEPVTYSFDGLPADAPGYMHRLEVDQNYSALGMHCLMVRRTVFASVGSLDEQVQPWAHIDLCLRLQQAGYLNVWTPRAQLLVSDVDATPATPEQENSLYARWLPELARDKAGNPNLEHVTAEGVFVPADSQLSWRPLSVLASLPTVLAYPDKAIACLSRIEKPFKALTQRGLIDGAMRSSWLNVVEVERFSPDSIVMQGRADIDHVQIMLQMKSFTRALKIYDLATYLPDAGVHGPYTSKRPEDVLELLRLGASCMDRMLVPTPFMAQVFDGFNADLRVVEDRLAMDAWGALQSQRRSENKPRVGWVGGLREANDLNVLADVIKILANEVHWIILGSCPEPLRPFMHEVHGAVPDEQYPQKLASLNLDLAVVPLQDNLLNRCKSNIRLLEHGACGVPVICTDIEAHHGNLPVKRVSNQPQAWLDAIRMHASDLDAVAELGDYLRQCVQRDWGLDDATLLLWRDAWVGA